jgi:effector-binding domain-containing protein
VINTSVVKQNILQMKFIKYLLYIVLALVALLCAIGLFAKKQYHLERSVVIKAPHSIVKEKVSRWEHFNKWSPWQELDPSMQTKIDGIDGTVGATYAWVGNDAVGTGTQTFTSITDDKIESEVKFEKPWKTVAPSAMALKKVAEGIEATWSFDMTIPFPFNVFAMLTDMDRGVGKDYANGLQRLKSLCEGEANLIEQAASSAKMDTLPMQQYMGIRKTVKIAEIDAFCEASYTTLMGGLDSASIVGAPVALYYTWDEANASTEMVAAVPVAAKTTKSIKLAENVEVINLGGKAALIDYIGSYENSKLAHLGMDQYLSKNGLIQSYPVMEVYLNSPETEKDPAKLHTQIYYFVK